MFKHTCLIAALSVAIAGVVSVPAMAQSKGKLVCWKDKSGKVIGCGDTVPPEYRDNAAN